MSDLFSRLAARAVGVAPLAAPRPTTPFEREPQGELHELVVEVPARPRAPAPGADASPPPPARAGEPSADERSRDEAAAAQPPGEPVAEAEAVSEPVALERRADPRGAPPTPAPDGLEAGLETVVLASAASSEGPPPVHGEDVDVSAARAPAAVAAMPSSARAAAARSPAPAGEARQAAPEAPVVRVHIGRLEVRANLQEPPRQPASQREPLEPALSLSDYLRRSGGAR